MITIETNKTNFLFKYKGNIEIYIEKSFLCITADSIVRIPNTLYISEVKVFDKFWLVDIECIKGC